MANISSPIKSAGTTRNRRGIDDRNSKIRFRCEYSSTPLKVLQSRGWIRVQDPSWDIWWCETSELRLALDGPQRLDPRQRVSHFRNHCELTRKNYLYRNLRRYRRLLIKAGMLREAELCDAMPMTFELPAEYRMLVEEHRRCHGTIWIVKPAAGSQGRGIFLFQRLKDLADWRTMKETTTTNNESTSAMELGPPPGPQPTYVVQKYIDKPYLLEGRKFDLRIYVLVTSFQPLKVWLAREGFARLSGEQFSLERIGERRVHLTNMSIQLKPGRERDDEQPTLGRKWPLSCLRRYLTNRHGQEAVQRLLRAIAVYYFNKYQDPMTNIIVRHDKGKTCLPINDNGNVSVDSLKNQFPKADSLAYKDAEGKMCALAVSLTGEIIIDSKKSVDDYYLHYAAEAKAEAIESEAVKNPESKDTTENKVPNGVSNGHVNEQPPIENPKERSITPNENKTSSKRVLRGFKTLRIGWLHKGLNDKRYKRMPKPQGGVRRIKLDESKSYNAAEIRRLAIQEFDISEVEYEIDLGLFGGRVLTTFSRPQGDSCDDVWDYCRVRSTKLYQLNLFLLTRSRPPDDIRILYRYARVSKYSGESFYTECDRWQLHNYVFEEQCGDGPALEDFEPLELGYLVSRVEKDGKVLKQFKIDLNKSMDEQKDSYEFPEAKTSPGEHEIVYDLDEMQGIYNGVFGIGVVLSCTAICEPFFTWYRDGEVYKSAEDLFWLSNVRDKDKAHIWSCTVSCKVSNKQIKSKEIEIKD